jgi:hypothetical protein
LYEYVLSLFKNMLTAGLPHILAPLGSRTLSHALPDSRTLPRTLPHTAALRHTAVRFAAHCSTLHEFECRTPHTTCCTPHTIIHRN